MKTVLLILSLLAGGNSASGKTESTLQATSSKAEPQAPASGDAPAHSDRLCRLRGLFAELKLPEICIEGPLKEEELAVIESGTAVFLAGAAEPADLTDACRRLRFLGFGPILVIDALAPLPGVESAVDTLSDDKNLFQVTVSGAVKGLIKSAQPFVYAYPKADNTATIVVLFDKGTQVLCIKRKHPPFQGEESLPGGFLKVHLETLRQCARREAEEETGVSFAESEIIPVDERSAPGRDPRGHVVDHGYLVVVPPERKAEIVGTICAGDDAAAARLMPVAALLMSGMAFDHADLLRAALKVAGLPEGC